MRTAVYPGSFDPITIGHLDIIERASRLFDQVIVLVSRNPDKSPFFTVDARLGFISRAIAALPNVSADAFSGLLADYLKQRKATAIIKGLRAVSDFEYEFQMALANKTLDPAAETIFLAAQAKNMYLSSSLVRQIGALGGSIKGLVPVEIENDIQTALQEEIS